MKTIFCRRASKKIVRSWQGVLEDSSVMRLACIRLVLSLLDGLTKEWCIATYLFWRTCRKKARSSGWLFLALYLKQTRVIIQKIVAGDEFPTPLSPAVSCTRRGVPRIIPSFHRKRLLEGDPAIVRLYMSMCTLSKVVLLAKPVSKDTFQTIVTPFDIDSVVGMVSDIVPSIKSLLDRYVPKARSIPLNQGLEFVPTWKSVPSAPWYKALLKKCKLQAESSLFLCFFSEIAAFQSLMTFVHAKGEQFSQGCLWPPYVRYPFDSYNREITHHSLSWFETRIGPLLPSASDMQIPADTGLLCGACTGDGKRRLFAIGNFINQRLLHPLHTWLMSVLRLIPQDGTFDQTRPLDLLHGVRGTVHSVDLKAATDRWPLHLLFALIRSIFGSDFASAAVNSTLGCNVFRNLLVKKLSLVSFVAGQPLGYLSSWPLFALSHHLVVWYCAEQVYPGRKFRKYAILGDDVIIVDDSVREQYDRVLARLGVQVSISKTLRSKSGAGEFAKRFRINRMTVDVSPVSLRQMLKCDSLMDWYANAAMKFQVRFSTLLRMASFGFKARSRPVLSAKHGSRARRYSTLYIISLVKRSGVSIEIALSTVLKCTIPPEVLGVIHSKLYAHLVPKEPTEPPIELFPYPGMRDFLEYSLYKGWIRQYLAYLKWYSLLVSDPPSRLDHYLSPPVFTNTWFSDRRENNVEYGLLCRVFDWTCTHIRHPPKCITSGTDPLDLH